MSRKLQTLYWYVIRRSPLMTIEVGGTQTGQILDVTIKVVTGYMSLYGRQDRQTHSLRSV